MRCARETRSFESFQRVSLNRVADREGFELLRRLDALQHAKTV